MQKTENVSLPIWEKSDPIRMTDFNEMTAALDAAIGGRCRMVVASYVGNGESGPDYDPSSIDFAVRPVAVIFPYLHGCRMVLNVEGEQIFCPDGNFTEVRYFWEGNTLKWFVDTTGEQKVLSRYQMNGADVVYPYLALYQV